MKKIALAIAALALVGNIAFANGGAAQSGSKGSAFIGLAMPETHVERWIKDGTTLKNGFQAKGYQAEVQYGNADQLQQNQQIQSFLTQGAKALVIGNINDGVGSVVAEANSSGVYVLAYDRIIQGTNQYAYYLTFNNYAVGTLMGQAIEKALNLAAGGGPKYITYFAGSPTDANANFFFQGAVDVIQKYVDNGTLVVVGPKGKSYTDTAFFQAIATENWSGPLAKQRMEGLLVGDAAGVTLDAVLAPNDTLARAIIEALKADAKYKTKLPFVTGQDAEFDSIVAIKNGDQGMTVFKDTAKLAEAAIAIVDAAVKGQSPSIAGAKFIDKNKAKDDPIGAIADTRTPAQRDAGAPASYVDTFLLTPIAITKDNISVPVNAGFYPPEQANQLK